MGKLQQSGSAYWVYICLGILGIWFPAQMCFIVLVYISFQLAEIHKRLK